MQVVTAFEHALAWKMWLEIDKNRSNEPMVPERARRGCAKPPRDIEACRGVPTKIGVSRLWYPNEPEGDEPRHPETLKRAEVYQITCTHPPRRLEHGVGLY